MGDRQKLVDFLMDNLPKEHPWIGRVKELVDKLEAEGFAFVVRCKDCKAWNRYEPTSVSGRCCYLLRKRMDDDFCSFGERRTEE